MPELPEEMYCSQQICIPPSFPYLLRQYAKAAIRTQPTDLLKWSTAYFRCLSLNLRPPVKPRLEYPIPKTHFGLTPGWLRALLYQLQNSQTVSFKILWDRWIGACMEHNNLIESLCLGGFTDAYAIPWFPFIALCAGYLTENLTQTMILVCELLTEEPEGGSASITLETFVSLYKFLAAIDASEPQFLKNLYFTDSLISLYREPPEEIVEEVILEIAPEEEEESIEEEEQKEEVVEEEPVEDLTGIVISCPDLAKEDYKTEEDFLLRLESADELEEEASATTMPEELEIGEEAEEAEAEEAEKAEKAEAEEQTADVPIVVSVDTIVDYLTSKEETKDLIFPDTAEEYNEEEEYNEDEENINEDLKYETIEMPFILDPSAFMPDAQSYASELGEEKAEETKESAEEEDKYESIWIDKIPGIGPITPAHLVEAVIKYMHECASYQQGLVMPRNIRHYSCPPLEVLEKQ